MKFLVLGALIAFAGCAGQQVRAGGSLENGRAELAEDARGVPIHGTTAAHQPRSIPNFFFPSSVNSPGSGAFAGSGRAALARPARHAAAARMQTPAPAPAAAQPPAAGPMPAPTPGHPAAGELTPSE